MRCWADKTNGVQYSQVGNLKWFGFQNHWICRIKHIDDRYLVGVSPTDASDEYDRNKVPEAISRNLISSDPATMLYIGWQVTENAPASPAVSLVCNNANGEPEWIWPFSGQGPGSQLVLPAPDEPYDPPPGSGVRVKVKRVNPERKKKSE